MTGLPDAGSLWLNLAALCWFMFCWVGYTRYAWHRGRDTPCLASVLHLYRKDWMSRLLLREQRIADASLISNLERNTSFFASSTLLILAGLITVMGASDQAQNLLHDLPFVAPVSREVSEMKLLIMLGIFVYAFFTFSWAMRQYNFASVLFGAAPLVGEKHVSEIERKAFTSRAAKVLSKAAHSFNLGLRSYYFALATLSWFINPWVFMMMTTGVVYVLYRREFRSAVLEVLMATPTHFPESSAEETAKPEQ
ncbi:DUF599 domain-containing protein [Pseudomonas sp. G11-1]|uniref:DUF599 family protein n=1 Tax=Halopseudomonas bauzanensis TaxID=653930 RepID=A0A031MBW9_9GAMM|nr:MULTISPECIES: DUF599 family protein [Halopseudomonas]MCO5786198.1 DUF599 domain-containing protein [Pseudomonas sp. G11-1]MCO5789424.1 DUF599 domain-containing protein [Pseudomonas sp. G11-2]EZQ17274.1 membrane protein [Halopseudomonas bauzanensis]TKA90147.1 DUF599 family protein [Halopseudomonas bauzanensis]WGK62873.1 DUF599 family protein [Halopseudomonas sp. SMJS2]